MQVYTSTGHQQAKSRENITVKASMASSTKVSGAGHQHSTPSRQPPSIHLLNNKSSLHGRMNCYLWKCANIFQWATAINVPGDFLTVFWMLHWPGSRATLGPCKLLGFSLLIMYSYLGYLFISLIFLYNFSVHVQTYNKCVYFKNTCSIQMLI